LLCTEGVVLRNVGWAYILIMDVTLKEGAACRAGAGRQERAKAGVQVRD
jgi:hypothetical protein